MEPSDDKNPLTSDFPPEWRADPRVREAVVDALRPVGEGLETRVALERLLARRPALYTAPNVRPERARHRGLTFALSSVTAVLALAVGLWAMFRPVSPRTQPVRTYATATGQQASMTLTDGTRVTLAPRSVLSVTHDFGSNGRTVSLDGEAYFNVAHAEGAPFVVRTGAISTRVLGTAFVVRRYASDVAARIAVISGKVVVTAHTARHPNVTLVAGGVGQVTDSTASVTAAGDRRQYTDWQRGNLVFDETPAEDVLATLSRWYGYEFRVADSTLSRRRLTVVLSTKSSREAFSTLKELLDVELAFNQNVVTLTPRRTAESPVRDRREAQRDLTPNRSEAGR